MQEHTKTIARGWIIAAAVLALTLLAPTQGPHLSQARGSVEIGVGEPPAWKAARSGDPIGAGQAVRTGPGASAELALGTRTVRLYENSLLRIPVETASGSGPRAVELQSGRGLFDVLRRAGGDNFDVRTPEVVVSVKGTRFLVDAGGRDAAAAVSVFRGEVGVRALAQELAHEVRVRPGFTALGGAGRALELEVTPFADPWQGWSSGKVAPRPAPAARQALPPAKAAVRDAKAAAERLAERGMASGAGVRPGMDRPKPGVAPAGSDPRFEDLPGSLDPSLGAPDRRLKPGDLFNPVVPPEKMRPSVPPREPESDGTLKPGGAGPEGINKPTGF